MTRHVRSAAVLAVVVACAALVASPGASQTRRMARTLYGVPEAVGNGVGRTWVRVDADGQPVAVGVSLSEDALSGLPDEMAEYRLPLPAAVAVPPFDHVGVNWNPHGHIPPGIYDRPHFDFHFYMISPSERDQITARDADLDRVRQVPPAAQTPRGFIFAPGGEEPRMGSHWVDPQGGEFHGRPFTHTLIYGFYAGRMNFIEPMVTLGFLRERPGVTARVTQSDEVAVAGYYPTRYAVRYDSRRRDYRVSLEGLRLRQVPR